MSFAGVRELLSCSANGFPGGPKILRCLRREWAHPNSLCLYLLQSKKGEPRVLLQTHIPFQRYCPICRGRGQHEQRKICPACYGEGHFNEAKFIRDANAYYGLRTAGFLSDFLRTAIDVSVADSGNIQLFNSLDGTLRITAHRGFRKEFLDFFNVVRGRHCGCGAAMSRMSRVLVFDVRSDPIFKGDKSEPVMLRANARACQSTPLVGSSGQLLGMLSTHYREPRDFSRGELHAIDEVTKELSTDMEEHLRRAIL